MPLSWVRWVTAGTTATMSGKAVTVIRGFTVAAQPPPRSPRRRLAIFDGDNSGCRLRPRRGQRPPHQTRSRNRRGYSRRREKKRVGHPKHYPRGARGGERIPVVLGTRHPPLLLAGSLSSSARHCGNPLGLGREGTATPTAASAAGDVTAPKIALGPSRRSGCGNRRRRY